jgi:hypothetical protein
MHPTTYSHNTTVIGNERYIISAHPIPKAPGGCPFSIKQAYDRSKSQGATIGDGRYTISADPIPKAPGECPSQKAAHSLFKKNGHQ